MTNKCSRCDASIPNGRNFCVAHYTEALVDYETALADYERNIGIWNSMSDDQKSAADTKSEDSTIGGISGLVGFILGAIVWYGLDQAQDIDALVGLGILAFSVFIFTAIKPIRILVGRFTRFLFMAVIYFIVLWIVGAIISIWSPFLQENASDLSVLLAILMLIISAINEASGGHHSSGKPTKPTKPRP
jgi:hypothetical protein